MIEQGPIIALDAADISTATHGSYFGSNLPILITQGHYNV